MWSIDIPIYYFLGAAGAALTLGAALQLAPRGSRRDLRRLSATCHWIGIIGSTAGAGFLVHDLGRPERFLHMMRVFRPTSPMNMGVWILSGAAPTAITTGLLINRKGVPGAIGEVSGWLSGLFGAALAGYTGVLVSNTAIPIWLESRRWMPVLFAASGASAAVSIIDVFSGEQRARRHANIWNSGAVGGHWCYAGRARDILCPPGCEALERRWSVPLMEGSDRAYRYELVSVSHLREIAEENSSRGIPRHCRVALPPLRGSLPR